MQQQLEDFLTSTHFDKKELQIITEKFISFKQAVAVPVAAASKDNSASSGTTSAAAAASSVAIKDSKDISQLENGGRIDRQRFRDILSRLFGITDSLLMDRVFKVFDVDADNYVGYGEWVRGMSVFLLGKVEERIKFCFKVYDLNSDRYISKEEMFQMLQHCLVRGMEEDEDGIKDIVDLMMKKMDEDRDGRVNELDYATAVLKDALLMEAFGQCLPDKKMIDAFLEKEWDIEQDCYPVPTSVPNLKQQSPRKVSIRSESSTPATPTEKSDKKAKAGMAM